MIPSNVTHKVVIAQFNRILNDLAKHVCTTLGLPVPTPDTGLPQRDERRPDLRNTPSSHQGSHGCDSRQLVFPNHLSPKPPSSPPPSRLTTPPKEPRRVPDLGRWRDVLHRARGAVQWRHLVDGTDYLLSKMAAAAPLYPTDRPTEIARLLLVCQPHRRHRERWQGCAEGGARRT